MSPHSRAQQKHIGYIISINTHKVNNKTSLIQDTLYTMLLFCKMLHHFIILVIIKPITPTTSITPNSEPKVRPIKPEQSTIVPANDITIIIANIAPKILSINYLNMLFGTSEHLKYLFLIISVCNK